MKKLILLTLLLGWTAIPAQAVTWSPAGAGAQYIPLLDGSYYYGGAFNNSAISEIVASSPGKEFLDTKANQSTTGFIVDPVTGIPGAGTVTSISQNRLYSSKGKLLFNEVPLKVTFNFPAGTYNQFVAEGGGIADVAGKKYVVSSRSADLSVPPTAVNTPYVPLFDVWVQVSDLATQKRVKIMRFQSTLASFWKLFSVEVNDINADGNDDLITRYQHINADGSSRMFTIVRNLLTGAAVQGGYSLYAL